MTPADDLLNIKEVGIIESMDVGTYQERLNRYLEGGYVLRGPCRIIQNPNTGTIRYIQEVVLL